jgi:hypothetical protein
MSVCIVISLLTIPYVHRIYLYMYGSGQPYKSVATQELMALHAHVISNIPASCVLAVPMNGPPLCKTSIPIKVNNRVTIFL